MAQVKKVFKKGAFVGIAALLLSAGPKEARAQDTVKAKTEVFDLKKASESEKKVYKAMVDLLSFKFAPEAAAEKAGKIMSESRRFDKPESAQTFIRVSVEKNMGKEYYYDLQTAREKVRASSTEVRGDTIIERSTTIDKLGTVSSEKVTTPTQTREKTVISGTFSILKLTPEERKEYDKIVNKLKVANKLRKRSDIGSQAIAQTVFMNPDREKALKLHTGKIQFRDVDEKNFVAFNPDTGEGTIFAPKSEHKKIFNEIKKVGGIPQYVALGASGKQAAAAEAEAGKAGTRRAIKLNEGR